MTQHTGFIAILPNGVYVRSTGDPDTTVYFGITHCLTAAHLFPINQVPTDKTTNWEKVTKYLNKQVLPRSVVTTSQCVKCLTLVPATTSVLVHLGAFDEE